jgi:hypothetical protein
MNKKILKNLLLYPGSPRPAFSAPRDAGSLGRVMRLLEMKENKKLLERVGC